jgi:hypothetical protein
MGKNKAMLFKWLWRISSENSARWKEIIFKKYQPTFKNGLPVFDKPLSGIWKGIMFIIKPGNASSDT